MPRSLLSGLEILVSQYGGRVDWAPSGDVIAYSSIQNLSGGGELSSELYTMDTHGENTIPLTVDSRELPHLSNDQPAYHPDGRFLLFQSADPDLPLPGIPEEELGHYVQGGFGFNNNLWIRDMRTGQYAQLTEVQMWGGTLHPHFSPDGRQVFWSSFKPPWQHGDGWVLAIADFDDSVPQLRNVRYLAPKGYSDALDQCYEAHAVSRDGRHLLYSYSPTMPLDLDILVTDVEGIGRTTNLTKAPGVWDEHAHWSPDERTIAWVSSRGYDFTPSDHWQRDLRTEVWIMNADGSNPRQVTRFNERDQPGYEPGHVICADLEWSPDGEHLVVCRTAGGQQQILRLDLDLRYG